MRFFEIDLGTVFFGSSAQNDAEWWSYCRKLIYFCVSSLILKLEANFWVTFVFRGLSKKFSHVVYRIQDKIKRIFVLAFLWKSPTPDVDIRGNRRLPMQISAEILRCIFSKSTSGLRFSDPARKMTQNGGLIVANWCIFVWVFEFWS